jgi:iron complex transport system substrate-binding protein
MSPVKMMVFGAAALALAAGCKGDEAGGQGAAAEATPPGATREAPSEAPEVEEEVRIVTLGGTASEIAFALGHGDEVVGVDASSAYPAEVDAKPKLGYFRKISPEGVLALEPTLVIAQEGVGPQTAIDQIKAAGVAFEVLPEAEDLEGAVARIELMGEKLGEQEKASRLVATLRADVAEATRRREAAKSTPRALFIYARGPNMTNVMGEGTSAARMFTLAGIENAVSVDGFKPLTPESVIQAAPDVLVLPTKGAQSVGGEEGVLKLPGVAQTPAGKERDLVLVDDLMLLGFGPRFGKALLELQEKTGVVGEGG